MLTLLPFVSTVILSVAMLQASWGWCQAYPWCTCSIPLLSHLKSKTFASPLTALPPALRSSPEPYGDLATSLQRLLSAPSR